MSELMCDKQGAAKLDSLTEQLLDLTKNNRLLNFRDFRSSTIEVLAPDYEDIFNHLDGVKEKLDVFSKSFERRCFIRSGVKGDEEDDDSDVIDTDVYRQAYLDFALKNKEDDEIVLFSSHGTIPSLIRKVAKNAHEILGETGVNVVYLAAGFVLWTESEDSNCYLRAPILLIPVQIRRGSGDEYSIVRHDDEMVFNPTFRYKLEHDFGLSSEEFTEGRTSPGDFIENLKARLAKDKPTWQVSEACRIGLFTFQKMNMYSDLKKNKGKILTNPLIQRLFGMEIGDSAAFLEPGGGTENPVINLKTVADADSSQIQAIEAAKSGDSFVLQGPPGTGKSQTITNIIAECLSDGKKVLFVSEKMAALNVVYTNLRNAGLQDYCLELHSNKAKKREVISKICESILPEKCAPEPIHGNGLRKKYQKQLDSYDEAIHRKLKPLDMSLYQMYGAMSGLRDVPDVQWTASASSSWNAEKFQDVIRAIGNYSERLEGLGCDCREHAWFGFSKIDLKYDERLELERQLETAGRFLRGFNALAKEISDTYQIHCLTPDEGLRWEQFFRLAASEHSVIAPGCLQRERFDHILKLWDALKEQGMRTLESRNDICSEYFPDVLQLDGRAICRRLRDDFDNVLLRWFKQEFRALLKDFRKYRINPRFINYGDACNIAERLRSFQSELTSFESAEAPVKEFLGEAYNGIYTDWDTVSEQIDSLRKLFEANLNFSSFACCDAGQFADCRKKFLSYADRLSRCFDEHSTEALTYLGNVFDVSAFDVWHTEGTKVADKFETCRHAFGMLDRWCAFALARQELGDRDVEAFVDLTYSSGILPARFADVFRKAFYSYQINLNMYDTPVLKYFDAAAHESVVRKFCELDRNSSSENRSAIRNRLNKGRPTRNEIMAQVRKSPLKMLLHEAQKRTKVMSIRKVMHVAGKDILRLKPCFLMSPLSVSTYLEEDFEFDVIIFDEASQIFPQDAIGAIYRGRQLIVVGDSKQMPPSNFFRVMEHTSDDEENSENEAELAASEDKGYESILDWCAASYPAYCLLWHYRSRSEALIAFSNLRFYDGKLMTFPTPQMNADSFGISYRYVPGRFENQVNRIEAEEVVRQVIDCLQRCPDRSLGVIVFSRKQEDRVEFLLEKKLRDYPELRKLMSEDRPEPFFVKNLETVQGYERDTIIFSVAYGPNSSGDISHNFGPLNRKGGERRLNVAVTRARYNIRVISSMHGSDIDLKRTNAEGAKNLKLYLEYAEHGASVLSNPSEVPHGDVYDSVLERDVCEFLRGNRILVDTQVGCAGYRIDLAVKSPHSSDYVLAIECDGATYHSAKNVRDRDRLRQEVLERKGWLFKRIWSTDWYKHRQETASALLETVRRTLREADAGTVQVPPLVAECEPAADGTGKEPMPEPFVGASDNDIAETCETQQESSEHLPASKSSEVSVADAGDRLTPERESVSAASMPEAEIPAEVSIPGDMPPHISASDDFLEYAVADIGALAVKYNPKTDFSAFVRAIAQIESPLSVDWLEHRLVGYFDRRVVTDVFDREFRDRLNKSENKGVVCKGDFLWLEDKTADKVIFRKNTCTVKRKIEDIAPEELAAGLLSFSRRMKIRNKKILFRKFAAEGLLLSRVYDKTEKYLNDAYRLMNQ